MAKAFEWSDIFKLGFAPMDETHEEFVEIVNAMLHCPDADLLMQLQRFELHAKEHFDEQLKWMRETGFPSTDCHADEHAAVMRSVEEVLTILRNGGDFGVARRLAQALADWFPGHADYLDSALAQWMVKKKTNGVPLVFRRKESFDSL